MKDYIATIVKNEKIAENIYAVTFLLDEDIAVRCGQFGDISVGGHIFCAVPSPFVRWTEGKLPSATKSRVKARKN